MEGLPKPPLIFLVFLMYSMVYCMWSMVLLQSELCYYSVADIYIYIYIYIYMQSGRQATFVRTQMRYLDCTSVLFP